MARECGCDPGIDFTIVPTAEVMPGTRTADWIEAGITYCPLHKAAPTLLSFAQLVSGFFDNDSAGHAVYLKEQADIVIANAQPLGDSRPGGGRTMRIPDGLIEIDEHMTNFDHSVDAGMDSKLRQGITRSEHSGWNFHGDVWFADGQFHEEVWIHHAYQETFSAPTLGELMAAVNDEYGSE